MSGFSRSPPVPTDGPREEKLDIWGYLLGVDERFPSLSVAVAPDFLAYFLTAGPKGTFRWTVGTAWVSPSGRILGEVHQHRALAAHPLHLGRLGNSIHPPAVADHDLAGGLGVTEGVRCA